MSSANLETRHKILEATWRLMESGEGAGVRMSDIAKAAGISRQAVYLHFPTRAELLIATTHHLGEVKNVDALLAKSRASTGVARLDAFIEAWGTFIPEVYGVLKALMAMKDSDEAAAAAWNDRMAALRHGCEAAVKTLKETGVLAPTLAPKQAVDILWTLLSLPNWEQLTVECGWPQKRYIEKMKETARRILTD